MDSTLLPVPDASEDLVSRDLIEIDTAIALVARGVATRVSLVSLSQPTEIAATGLAHAQAARVSFRLDRLDDGAIAVTLGPRT